MATLLERLCAIDPRTVLFRSATTAIDAGALREAVGRAAREVADDGGDLALLCRSAAMQFVGLMVAAVLGRRVVLPAHDAPAYLDEIGADGTLILSDADLGRRRQYLLRLPDAAAPSSPPLQGTDPEVVFFTSGSTGAPKAVAKPLSRLEAEGALLHRLWPLLPGRVEATVSHQHIYGLLFRIVWPVLAGRASRCEVSYYWEQLVDRLDQETILVTSATHLTRMPNDLPWPEMRPALVFSSGAPLPLDAARKAATRLGQLPIEVFGSTETGGVGWRQQIEADASWTPFPGINLSTGENGSLSVRSPFIGDDRPSSMADAVEILADGRFRLGGRLDRVVKIEGKRVSLPRVEEVLLALPEIADAAVADLPERKGFLGAAVVPSPLGRDALEREGAHRFSRRLRRELAERLEPMERPKSWRFLQALPTNSQGKRPAGLIRELFAAKHDVLPPSEVVVLSDTAAELALRFERDLVWFDGHFPGRPILPGIAQIHLSCLFAEKLWRVKPEACHMARVKFRMTICPGDSVRLHLEHDAGRASLHFRYLKDGKPASEGVIGHM
jgi:hypothetical protein